MTIYLGKKQNSENYKKKGMLVLDVTGKLNRNGQMFSRFYFLDNETLEMYRRKINLNDFEFIRDYIESKRITNKSISIVIVTANGAKATNQQKVIKEYFEFYGVTIVEYDKKKKTNNKLF